MPTISIDRLALKLANLSEQDGRRLAELIAEGLAQATIPVAGPASLDRLWVNVTSRPGMELDALAAQVVAEIVQQLESTL